MHWPPFLFSPSHGERAGVFCVHLKRPPVLPVGLVALSSSDLSYRQSEDGVGLMEDEEGCISDAWRGFWGSGEGDLGVSALESQQVSERDARTRIKISLRRVPGVLQGPDPIAHQTMHTR